MVFLVLFEPACSYFLLSARPSTKKKTVGHSWRSNLSQILQATVIGAVFRLDQLQWILSNITLRRSFKMSLIALRVEL